MDYVLDTAAVSHARRAVDGPDCDDCYSDQDFGRLLTSAAADVRRNARCFVRNADQIEDLTQTVMLKAWQARGRFARDTNLLGWLYVILRNTVRSEQRGAGRERGWDDSFEGLLISPAAQNWTCDLIDLARAFAGLSKHQSRALRLVVLQGRSIHDVSREEGVSPQAIKSRVNRARQRLLAYQGGKPSLIPQPTVPEPRVALVLAAAPPMHEADREQVEMLRAFLAKRRRTALAAVTPEPVMLAA